ncbi:MAG: alpha-galactosidase [Lachnospiraceae bacterium]|nr:alpha-galactosidase [Lachnospiraceae bacterium]
MIKVTDNIFTLSTSDTTYGFALLESGHLEHLYYGPRVENLTIASKSQQELANGNSIQYSAEFPTLSMEGTCFEYSGEGKGDIREPFIELIYPDGSRTTDFVFDSYDILDKKAELTTLPSSYDENNKAKSLVINLKDKNHDVTLKLIYSVFEESNCITRSSVLINNMDEKIRLTRLMSTQVDFNEGDYTMHTFRGAWTREMEKHETVVSGARIVNASFAGTSSSRANAFIMLSRGAVSEEYGGVYGFNLIYSGNHYESVEDTSYHKVRLLTGINPQGFEFVLGKGDVFESPEAVMSYSNKGFTALSHNMHEFVEQNIVRGEWKNAWRPLLINSWEAAYFKFNEKSLLSLAKAAAKVGIELFVLDDGWFGKRDDDTSSLGDWYVNKKKLPYGLEGLIHKINGLGMKFGIWVEPEMVNVNSDLYRAHPEYALEIKGQEHSEGRTQRILDLTNPEVCDYVIDSMSKIFSIEGITYVKWDMNRIFSDAFSPYLGAEHEGEVFHRYVMGFYHIMEVLTKKFPHILFEGCSAGGNRFDLGILCYFPQIWASDDTDALYRVRAMTNYSYGYPMRTLSAHVSTVPNHQTLRITPLSTRYNVASFGPFGYEMNLCDLSKDELETVKAQVAQYKKWREVYFNGDFYRGRCGNFHEWTVVSKDKKRAIGLVMQELNIANNPNLIYNVKGLKKDATYKFYNIEEKINIRTFGDLINTASPVHIRNDSFMQRLLAKFYKMQGETEEFILSGEEAMLSGIRLKQAFGGVGFNERVRLFTDFSSRLYYMEEQE